MFDNTKMLTGLLIAITSTIAATRAHAQDFLKFSVTSVQEDIEALNSVAIGPDGHVYAAGISGSIYRWVIDQGTGLADSPAENLFSTAGSSVIMTGIAFDPSSTADNLILWSSYNSLPYQQRGFGGQIDRIELPTVGSGSVATSQNYISGLPVELHQNNGIAFGPDDRLYIAQGSVDASGGDVANPETPLSASVLVADVNDGNFLSDGLSVNVNTDQGYDPTAIDARVLVYAEGLRNAYDLAWHSNGNLYSAVNGNDGPAPLPDDPDTQFDESNVSSGRPDETFVNVQPGKFYGHPNPSQGNYISFAGNPTPGAGNDGDWENVDYPGGTLPEPGWDESLIHNILSDAGTNSVSPNGIVEYRGPNDLQGRVLVSFFVGGANQIAAVELAVDGSVLQVDTLTDLDSNNLDVNAPLDVAVDLITGRIYAASYDSQTGSPNNSATAGGLFLLTPFDPNAPPNGSFDGDLDIDADDFAILVANIHTDVSQLSVLGAYSLGDITGDRRIDYKDVSSFNLAYEEFVSSGSLASQLSNKVPEPASLIMLAVMLGILLRLGRTSVEK